MSRTAGYRRISKSISSARRPCLRPRNSVDEGSSCRERSQPDRRLQLYRAEAQVTAGGRQIAEFARVPRQPAGTARATDRISVECSGIKGSCSFTGEIRAETAPTSVSCHGGCRSTSVRSHFLVSRMRVQNRRAKVQQGIFQREQTRRQDARPRIIRILPSLSPCSFVPCVFLSPSQLTLSALSYVRQWPAASRSASEGDSGNERSNLPRSSLPSLLYPK